MAAQRFQLDRLQRLSLRDQVFDVLLGHIVSGTLGPGERIHDSEVADQLGVSRTPVREALQRLQAMHLVESAPGAMTRVASIDPTDAAAVFPVVADLHALAARLALKNFSDADIDDLKQHNSELLEATRSGAKDRMIDADTAFHDVFVQCAANSVLAELIAELAPRVRRFEYALFDDAAGFASVHDHERIIESCEAGDAAAVSAMVERNWLSLGDVVVAELASEPTAP